MAPPTRIELRDFIVDRFNRDELGLLCNDYFPDFYRDYADTNTPLTRLTDELIKHCERRDKLDNLRAAVHKQRDEGYEKLFGWPRQTEVRVRPRNPRQVFLSHAHEDTDFGRQLAQDLRDAGLQVWIAPDSIQPGELWAKAIDRGLRESGIFVVALSPAAAQSSWVEHELFVAIGYERGKHMQFIPLMAQDCDLDALPALLQPYQFLDFKAEYAAGLQQLLVRLNVQPIAPLPQELADAVADSRAFVRKGAVEELNQLLIGANARLAASARAALEKLADDDSRAVSMAAAEVLKTSVPEPNPLTKALPLQIAIPNTSLMVKLVRVPAGEFLMGSDKAKDQNARDNELPQHRVYLDEYLIGKYPITVEQFAAFAGASGYKTTAEWIGSAYVWNGKEWEDTKGADWQHPFGPKSEVANKQDHPVTCVSWDDATAFCKWLSAAVQRDVRLPTEAQREKAARGSDGRLYPWGDVAPDATRCNFNINEEDTTPVGLYSPAGDSPYGVADMAGNVWDWCEDGWNEKEYAARGNGVTKNPTGPARGGNHVVRGGAWFSNEDWVRSAYRNWNVPYFRNLYLGFRVVVISPLP